ncbi:MAG: T9SS type B sorting domain-containing protein, partial [Cruoricaptor ignavus]|nr:T9SS type B sorting domain-containing protein [Cruoricaptor ignavus]
KEKPLATSSARFKDAVIGITDDTENGLPASADRNTGEWTATNEAWEFTPNGRNITRAIRWYEDGNYLNTNLYNNRTTVSVCPKNITQVYTAEAIYTLRSGERFSIKENITVNVASDYPLPNDYTEIVCGTTSVRDQRDFNPILSKNPAENFNFKYYLSREDALVGASTFLAESLPIESNQTYYVRIENKTDSSCFRIALLKLGNTVSAQLTNRVQVCEAAQTDFILSRLLCQIVDSNLTYTNPRFRIGSSTGAVVTRTNLSSSSQIYLTINTSCGDITYGPISVNVTPGPILKPIAEPLNIAVCDIVTNNNPPLRESNFDWQKYFEDHNISFTDEEDVLITVHNSEANARNNVQALTSINEGNPAEDYTYDIWVRVQSAATLDTCVSACFSIVKVSIRVIFTKIILNVEDADADATPDNPEIFDTEIANIYLCRSTTERTLDLDVDSDAIIKVMNPVGGVGVTKTFHTSYADANNMASEGVSANQILRANETRKVFYIRYSLSSDPENPCYVVKQMEYNVETFPVRNTNSNIPVCSADISVPTLIQLSDYTQTILGQMYNRNPRPTLQFFADSSASSAISTIELSASNSPKSVWVKITSGYNTACETQLMEYKFAVVQGPILKTTAIPISINCDNNDDEIITYDLTSLNANFIDNPENYNIRYFRNYNSSNQSLTGEITAQTTNFRLSNSGTQTIYYRIGVGNTGCFSVGRVDFNINITETPIKLNDNQILLNCNNSGQVFLFNLNDTIDKLYSSENPTYSTFISTVSFYETENNANNATNPIANTENYPINAVDVRKDIWVRFESVNGCYSVKNITLKVINPNDLTFTSNDVQEAICDNNLSGNYTFNLKEWLADKINNSTVGNSFLRDYEATLGANYTFHKTNNASSPALSESEIINFHPDPVSQPSVFLKADANGCHNILEIKFDFGDISTLEFPNYEICRESVINLNDTVVDTIPDVSTAVNFEFFRSEEDLKNNVKIENPTTYQYENITDIWVKIIFADGICPRKGLMKFVLKTAPEFTMESETVYFCKSSESAVIRINPSRIYSSGLSPVSYTITGLNGFSQSGDYESFEVLRTDVEGKYQVTIFADNGCSFTGTEVEVKAYDVPKIYRLTTEGNTVTVLAEAANANRRIQYSLDGGDWKDTYVFHNLSPGLHKFYVRYADNQIERGCISEAEEVLILDLINTITPNGDGINDTWKIQNLDFFGEENTNIKIFDRQSRKVFEQDSNTEIVWDGYYNGRVLPTDTYWYVLILPDGRTITGWILLKNREN